MRTHLNACKSVIAQIGGSGYRYSMKPVLFLKFFFFFSFIILTGCINKVEYDINLSDVEKAKFIANLSVNHSNFYKCAYGTTFFILQNTNVTDVDVDKIIEDCDIYARPYYLSVYFSSFEDRPDLQRNARISEGRRNTANIALRNTAKSGSSDARRDLEG